MIILRGCAGSGKSTLASKLTTKNSCILSTDDYFYFQSPPSASILSINKSSSSSYKWQKKHLGSAHAWNQARAKYAANNSIDTIIIDNTNRFFILYALLIQFIYSSTMWEVKPYCIIALKFGYKITFMEPDTPWWKNRNISELTRRSAHGVDASTVEKMVENWEWFTTNDMDEIMKSEMPGRK